MSTSRALLCEQRSSTHITTLRISRKSCAAPGAVNSQSVSRVSMPAPNIQVLRRRYSAAEAAAALLSECGVPISMYLNRYKGFLPWKGVLRQESPPMYFLSAWYIPRRLGGSSRHNRDPRAGYNSWSGLFFIYSKIDGVLIRPIFDFF